MALSYDDLRKLTKAELIAEYNRIAASTQIGLSFLQEEIAQRGFEEQNSRMLAMTGEIRTLTRVVTRLTVVNVLLVAVTLYAAFRG